MYEKDILQIPLHMPLGEGHKLLAAHWTNDVKVGSVVYHRFNISKHNKMSFDYAKCNKNSVRT